MLLAVIIGLTVLNAHSQELSAQNPTTETIEINLDQAWSAIEALDVLAAACHVNLEPPNTENPPGAACRDFMAQMHGLTFQGYQSHCEAVHIWRDAQIAKRFSQTAAENSNNSQQSSALLDNMMRAEFVCGVDALAKRSAHIIPVYRSMDGIQQQYADSRQRLLNRIEDLQFQQRDTEERQRMLRALEDLRARQSGLTDELFERQALELLRQQMRQELVRPNP